MLRLLPELVHGYRCGSFACISWQTSLEYFCVGCSYCQWGDADAEIEGPSIALACCVCCQSLLVVTVVVIHLHFFGKSLWSVVCVCVLAVATASRVLRTQK